MPGAAPAYVLQPIVPREKGSVMSTAAEKEAEDIFFDQLHATIHKMYHENQAKKSAIAEAISRSKTYTGLSRRENFPIAKIIQPFLIVARWVIRHEAKVIVNHAWGDKYCSTEWPGWVCCPGKEQLPS
jgi:hypothetical protein